MENDKKQKNISILIYVILFSIIIVLGGFLIWSKYINYLYDEYTVRYSENCYKITYDANSITKTHYTGRSDRLCQIEITNFENGKVISTINKWIYKNRSLAKETYGSMVNPPDNVVNYATNIKLEDNVVEFTYLPENTVYESEEVKEKVESFTTNEEIISYYLEEGEKNNFWLSEECKRIN